MVTFLCIIVSDVSDDAGCYFVQLLAHLVGLGHHGHQLDVVVEDGQQDGIRLTGTGAGLTYTQTHLLSPIVPDETYSAPPPPPPPPTQVDAFSSSQFRLEVVVVVAAPVVRAPLRGVTDEQVGAAGTQNQTVLQRTQQNQECVCVCGL